MLVVLLYVPKAVQVEARSCSQAIAESLKPQIVEIIEADRSCDTVPQLQLFISRFCIVVEGYSLDLMNSGQAVLTFSCP
jgi:hypothetical protein